MHEPPDPGPALTGDFTADVLAVVAALRPGECISYGEVAAEAGRPGAARAVGTIMRQADGRPWWRVIRADGSLAMGEEQARRLRAEGVVIVNGRVRPAGR